jgi:hypothetical protein
MERAADGDVLVPVAVDHEDRDLESAQFVVGYVVLEVGEAGQKTGPIALLAVMSLEPTGVCAGPLPEPGFGVGVDSRGETGVHAQKRERPEVLWLLEGRPEGRASSHGEPHDMHSSGGREGPEDAEYVVSQLTETSDDLAGGCPVAPQIDPHRVVTAGEAAHRSAPVEDGGACAAMQEQHWPGLRGADGEGRTVRERYGLHPATVSCRATTSRWI